MGTIEQHRTGGCSQGVDVAREQRDYRRFRQEREPLGIDGGQHGRPLAQRKQHGLTRAGRFHYGRQHGVSSLTEIAVRRKFGTQIRQRFNCS